MAETAGRVTAPCKVGQVRVGRLAGLWPGLRKRNTPSPWMAEGCSRCCRWMSSPQRLLPALGLVLPELFDDLLAALGSLPSSVMELFEVEPLVVDVPLAPVAVPLTMVPFLGGMVLAR